MHFFAELCINDDEVEGCSYLDILLFLLPPPAIYHLVPQSTPQQPALGEGWNPRILILDHAI